MRSTRAQGALSVGVLQAFRALLIGFIPIALITLIAWAAGGSGNGKSGDAIHGAGWIWLAAHHVGFNLLLPPGGVAGHLWLLPLGLSVIPWFVLRDSGRRITASVDQDQRRLALFALAATYGLSLALAAEALATRAVSPVVWAALPNGFFIALICGAIGVYGMRDLIQSIGSRSSAFVKTLWRGIGATSILLYGASLLLLASAVVVHWSRFVSLLTVLDAGWVGLPLLIALIFAAVPNAVVMTASIVAGAGIALGNHTLVSPLRVRLGELPAFPLLATVPNGRSLFLTLLPIITILASALGGFISVRAVAGLGAMMRGTVLHAFANVVILLLLNLLAGGALLGGQLSAVGASYLRILIFAAPLMLVGSLLGGLVSLAGSKSEAALFER